MAAPWLQSLSERGFPLVPRKRLLAIDPGSHGVKLLLLEETLGRLRVLRQELIELQGGGLLPEEELLRSAQDVVQELGQDPVALALPHYRALSQVVDLPPSEPAAIRRLIEAETVKLSGLGESLMVFDYVPLQPFGRHQHPFWVTLCREDEIQKQVDRCGLVSLDLCEVTTTANALVTQFLAMAPDPGHVVLADFGATGTVVVLLHAGQAVDAGHFATGGDALTEAVASQHGCSFEVAESLKRAQDLDGPPEETAAISAVLATWHGEVKRAVGDWLQEHPDLGLAPEAFRVVLCGGASLQPGLIPHLNRLGPFRFELWPDGEASPWPAARFAAAWGAALQHLGRSRQPVSLLPAPVRQFWRGHHSLNLIHSLILFLLGLLGLGLGFGTWQKYEVLQSKRELLSQSQSALEKALTTTSLTSRLRTEYDQLRPLLQAHRRTLDTLQTLSLLQQSRGTQAFWFVAFADTASYFAARPWGETNPPAATPPPATLPEKPGYIAELCLPEEGDAMRRALSQLVAGLKASGRFANVDLLSEERRRRLVDPGVLIADRHFALAFELPPDPFPPLPPPPERRTPAGPGGGPRRTSTTAEPGGPDRPAGPARSP